MRSVKNVLTALAVILLIALPARPSFAHTEVDFTTPATGEIVAAGEQLISVTFTDKIMDLADSTEIVVIDPSGNDVRTDCSGIENQGIYTNAFLETEGDYEVTWRTVAEDGHPITGKFSFSVSGNAETQYTQPSCATDTATAEPTPKVIATPLSASAGVEEPKEDALSPFIGSGLAVLGVSVIAWLLFRRKAQPKE